jgi:hypothetical protein
MLVERILATLFWNSKGFLLLQFVPSITVTVTIMSSQKTIKVGTHVFLFHDNISVKKNNGKLRQLWLKRSKIDLPAWKCSLFTFHILQTEL